MVEKAIEIMQKYQPTDGYELAFLGGKDSIVLLDIAKKAGVKFKAYYRNTTIDPVGLKGFIRDNYPCVQIVNPPKGFFTLIREKGYPSRFVRWCCDVFKEHSLEGKPVLAGVRRSESAKRAKYDFVQKVNGNKLIFPLLDWTDKQIWKYIERNKLALPRYYFKPYYLTRIGCVGCPLASVKKRIKDFRMFPKYAIAYFRAGKAFWEKTDTKAAEYFRDPYEYFLWYLSGYSSLQELKEFRNNLFGMNAKSVIEDTLKLKLE